MLKSSLNRFRGLQLWFVAVISVWASTTWARALNPPPITSQPPSGFGAIANNLMEPVTILSNFIGIASITFGLSFLFGALVKYMQHRVNPMAVPISTVILLLLMAVILICLPLSYKVASSGIPLSF
jgi:hypothetical protein